MKPSELSAFSWGYTRNTCLELIHVRFLLVLSVEEVRRTWTELRGNCGFALWAIETTACTANTTTTT